MKKRLISIVMSLVMLVSFAGIMASAEQDNAPTVEVDGRTIIFADQKPVILENEGRTLVPARGVFECMGASVAWDEENRLVTINSKDNVTRILITIDDPVMVVYTFTSLLSADKAEVILDAAPRIMNDRTMIPLRAISEALNTTVKWDEATRTVSIFTKDYEGDIESKPTSTSGAESTSNPESTSEPVSTSSPVSTSDPNQSPDTTTIPDSSDTQAKNGNVEMSISASKTTAAVGDVVDVYINVKGLSNRLKSDEGISGITLGVKYSNDILEYVEGSLKFNAKGDIMSAIKPQSKSSKLKIAGITTELDNISREDGEIVRVSFKVKSAGSASIKLSTDINTDTGADTCLDVMNSKHNISTIEDLKVNTNEIKIN